MMSRLRQYMEDTKTSQVELARRCGVSQPTVWGWLNGSLPSAETLKILSNETGLSIDELLDHEPPRHQGAIHPLA